MLMMGGEYSGRLPENSELVKVRRSSILLFPIWGVFWTCLHPNIAVSREGLCSLLLRRRPRVHIRYRLSPRFPFSAFAALTAVATGCGGGSAPAPLSPTPTLTPTPIPTTPSDRMRMWQAGDSWEYTVRAQTETEMLSGTVSLAVADGTFHDLPVLALRQSMNLGELSRSNEEFYRQDAVTADLTYLSMRAAPRERPGVALPGIWKGAVLSKRVVYVDSERTEVYSFILDKEAVTTPLGAFDAWKMYYRERNHLYVKEGHFYYVPQIGAYVKADYLIRFLVGPSAGKLTSYDILIRSTNTLDRGGNQE